MMNFIIIILAILVFLIVIFKITGIEFRIAKFENTSRIKVINNSYLETIKHFVDRTDYDYLADRIIFFNTWASWCGGCIKEIPLLNKIQVLHRDNKNIVFVSYCNDLQPGSIPEFFKEKKFRIEL
jgi:thiol-disulfide isomerase/thioredoxin